MNDTPTPETDAALASYHRARWTTHRTSPCFDLMPAEIARKLERERDEARRNLSFRRDLFALQEKQLDEARREREEARSEANRWRYADLGDDGITHPGDMFPWEEKP